MKAVIMAGGMGTRLRAVSGPLPKPMVSVSGRPILEHQIRILKENRITDIILIVGYRHTDIIAYFKDGAQFGVSITYFVEKTPLGTAGGLYYVKELLRDAPFLLINGDLIFDIDFDKFRSRFTKGKAFLFVHPNSHPHDSYKCVVDHDGKIIKWHSKELNVRNIVNAGIHLFSPRILDLLDGTPKDLDRDIIPRLMETEGVYAYRSTEYVKDPGTPDRLQKVVHDLESGTVSSRNLKKPQRAVFLDRDGVLNELNGFISKPDQLRLLPKVAESVRQINDSGYLAICITNQPVIARGDCSLSELDEIHACLDMQLGVGGAYLDDLFFCPHHPHKGYENERPEFKIDCDCRKPKMGLLLQASKAYHIDLSQSWMVGDSITDIQAGNAAGCRTAIIGDQITHGCTVFGSSLYEIVRKILPYDGSIV